MRHRYDLEDMVKVLGYFERDLTFKYQLLGRDERQLLLAEANETLAAAKLALNAAFVALTRVAELDEADLSALLEEKSLLRREKSLPQGS